MSLRERQIDTTALRRTETPQRTKRGRGPARRGKTFWALVALLGTLLPADVSAQAEEQAADFYRDRTIRLVVGYAPGGGFDTLARLLAPRLENSTGATVIVVNRPGAGGLVALNQVFAERPDGLTLMLANGQAAVLAQLLELDGVRYDLRQVPWLGRVAADPSVVLLGGASPYDSIGDLLAAERPVKWAGGGKADIMADSAACLAEALQIRARIIIGYRGSREAALATMRGETDAIALSAASAARYTKGGKLKPLAVLARQRVRYLPEVPTLFELISLSEDQAWWIDFRAGIAEIGRALLTTPGTPETRTDFLSAAIAEILTDKTFLAEVRAAGRDLDYAPSTRLHQQVNAALNDLEPDILQQVRSVILEKFYD